MKTLIAYYSLTGNNKYLAEAIQKEVGGDILEVKSKWKRNWPLIFFDVAFKRFPKIEKTNMDVVDYERVILVAPIWISKIASPLCTFIKQERKNLKNFSFISFCGGSEGLDVKIEEHLRRVACKEPKDILLISIAESIDSTDLRDAKRVMNYKMTSEDLDFFKRRITRFLGIETPIV